MGKSFLRLALGRYFKASVIIGTFLVALGVFIIFRCNNIRSKRINEYAYTEKALRDGIVSVMMENVSNIQEIGVLKSYNDSLSVELLSAKMEINILHGRMYYLSKYYIASTPTGFKYAVNHTDIDTCFFDKWYRVDMDVGRNGDIHINPSFRDSISVDLDISKLKVGGGSRSIFDKIFRKKKDLIRVRVENKNPYAEKKYREFVFVEDR